MSKIELSRVVGGSRDLPHRNISRDWSWDNKRIIPKGVAC